MDAKQRTEIAKHEVEAYREWLRREIQEPGTLSVDAARRTKVTIVAEGDSWFNYIIGKDVVWWLRNRFGYEIHEAAYPGATLNQMAYGRDSVEVGDLDATNITQLAETMFLIETYRPRIVMLSGGGNDIAGMEFIQLLKHAEAPVAGANLKVVEGLLDSYDEAYQVMLTAIEETFDTLQLSCHIILHGYDFPFPNGKGVGLGPVNFVGPWFHDSFSMRGYPLHEIELRRSILNQILTMFNDRLAAIAAQRSPRVQFLNLRNTLTEASQWANELHPTNAGFKLIAEKFDAMILSLVNQEE